MGRRTMKIIPIAVVALLGLVAGAVALCLAVGMVSLAIFPGPVTNGAECARGMLLSYLSVFVGGFLGAVVGGYAAYKYDATVETWPDGLPRSHGDAKRHQGKLK